MDAMRRRTLRALGAAAVGVPAAGCISMSGPTDGADEDDEDDGGDDGEEPVTVTDVAVRPEVVAPNTPDSVATYGDRGEQFLGVLVAEDRPASAFAVVAGDEEYPLTTEVGSWGTVDFGTTGEDLAFADGPRWYVARLPNPLESDAATLTWDGGERAFDAGVCERLARPPATYEVDVAVPDSVRRDEPVDVGLTVTNTADVDGEFVAAVNRSGPSVAYAPETGVWLDVPAGGTAEWEYRYTDAASGDVTFRFRWRRDSSDRTVTVESA